MTVGFFLVNTGTTEGEAGLVCAAALTRSVRSVMPGVRVVQLTDEATEQVAGVDDVRRLKSEPMARLRMRHQSSVTGDWLFVDSDVIFQRDVRNVFDRRFDIAVTTREWPHLKEAAGFAERMPHNVGVVFSRNHKFWAEVYVELGNRTEQAQQWMGDQQVICDLVAKRDRFQIAYLSGAVYNFPPAMGEDVDTYAQKLEARAAIVHYKGLGRKPMLMERIEREMVGCA